MIAFSIGSINIYRYGIMYLIGFTVGYLFLRLVGKKGYTKQWPGVHYVLTQKLDDFFLAIVIGGLIGGRLGEVLIYNLPYYLSNPSQFLAVRNGGMSFIGGIAGALLALLYLAKKRKLKTPTILRTLDHMAAITPFGIMMGRIGNFINKELYGIVVYNKENLSNTISNTAITLQENTLLLRADIRDKLLGRNLIYDYNTNAQVPTELRLNTNFLAAFGEGLLLLIILQILYRTYYKKNKQKPGTLTAIFLMIYSSVRFFLEYLRQDSQSYYRGPLTNSQWFFIVFFVVGAILLLLKRKRSNTNGNTQNQ